MPPNDTRSARMAGRAAALLLTGALAAPAAAAETEDGEPAPAEGDVQSDDATLDAASGVGDRERRNLMEQRHKLEQQRPRDRRAGEAAGDEGGEETSDEAGEAEAEELQQSRRSRNEEAAKRRATRERRP